MMIKYFLIGLLTISSFSFLSGQNLSTAEKESLTKAIKVLLANDQKYRSFLSYGTLRQELIDSIENLSDEDQVNLMVNNTRKLDKQTSDSLWILQNKIDLENINTLEKMVVKHGWLSETRLGSKISCIVLLFHTPTIKIQTMESLLLKEVKNKRMDPKEYGLFVDNMRLKHGKSQLYGTNAEFSKELMKEMPPTLESIEVTNNARRAIGLTVLKEGEYRIKK
jgi:hypothetical protein